jgi:hypothetical protein
MKIEKLKQAAEDLNSIFFGEDADDEGIDLTLKKGELEEQVKEAAALLEEEDELEDETIEVLRELIKPDLDFYVEMEKEGEFEDENKTYDSLIGIFKSHDILKEEDFKEEPEEPEKPEETEPEEAEEFTLEDEIKEAGSMKELKNIAKVNDEFKKMRGHLSSFKNVKALRKAMLSTLKEPEEVEEVSEEKTKKKPVTEKKEKKKQPAQKKEVPKKAKGKSGKGVIATIVECIEDSGKKGISKEQIFEKLKKEFPDRNEDSMKNTIGVQVPGRINKEKFEIEKLENGNYRKK